jgi:hypothetical protein
MNTGVFCVRVDAPSSRVSERFNELSMGIYDMLNKFSERRLIVRDTEYTKVVALIATQVEARRVLLVCTTLTLRRPRSKTVRRAACGSSRRS